MSSIRIPPSAHSTRIPGPKGERSTLVFEHGTLTVNDFLFAPAGLPHRFENFTDDLLVWVIFHGPEGGEASNE